MCVRFFASLFPEKTLAFISIDSTPYDITYYSKSDQFWLRLAAPACRWFPDKMLRRSIANANSISPEGRQVMYQMLESLSKADICEQMDIAYGHFLTEVRGRQKVALGVPTLLLLGEKDKTGKVAAYNQVWSANTGYPLIVIPKAAHLSNIDNYAAVNQAIEAFLAEVLPST